MTLKLQFHTLMKGGIFHTFYISINKGYNSIQIDG